MAVESVPTPLLQEGMRRDASGKILDVPAIVNGNLDPQSILQVSQLQLNEKKQSLAISQQKSSKYGLSLEDERNSTLIPTPLLNPKITTEVYLSKVKMLSPSVKEMRDDSKHIQSSNKKISKGTKHGSPVEEKQRKNIVNRFGKQTESIEETTSKNSKEQVRKSKSR